MTAAFIRRRAVLLAALIVAVPVALSAEGAGPADADAAALAGLLVAHDIVFDDIAWERHEGNGRFLQRSSEGPFARTSLGEWHATGDSRCLRWTRAMEWECYAVALPGEGEIVFTDASGNVTIGRLVPRGTQ